MRRGILKSAMSILLVAVLTVCIPLKSEAYTVQKGDTLSKIAVKYGTSVSKLKELNGITDANRISVGQELNVGNEGTNHNDKYYERATISKAATETLQSLFDVEWYKASYPDVVAVCGDSEVALFRHYLDFGLWETRQPNKDFNVNVYGTAYKDLQSAYENLTSGEQVLNLTLHYATYGKEENRNLTNIDKYDAYMSSQGIHSYGIKYFGAYHDANDPKTQKGAVAESITTPEPEPSGHIHNVVVDAAVPATLGGNGLTAGSHCSTCGNVISAQQIVSNEDVLANLSGVAYGLIEGTATCSLASKNAITFQSETHLEYIGHLVAGISSKWGFDTSEIITSDWNANYLATKTIPREFFEAATVMMFGKSYYSEYSSGACIGDSDSECIWYDSSSDVLIYQYGARGGGNDFSVTDLDINGNRYTYEISEYKLPFEGGAFVRSYTLEATLVDGHLQLDKISKDLN